MTVFTVEWKWQTMDGALTQVSWGGEENGPNAADRAKTGTKRSLMTAGRGLPIGLAVSGTNTHDSRLGKETIQSMPVSPPDKESVRQYMYMDKGYDWADIRATLEELGYVSQVLSPGEEPKKKRKALRYRARR